MITVDIGQRVEPVHLGHRARQARRRCRPGRKARCSRRDDMRIGELGDDHRLAPLRDAAACQQARPVALSPDSTNMPCSASRLARLPRGLERERAAVPVEGQAAFDTGADLVAQRHEIADRAEVDVGRVVPRVVQQLRHRHAAVSTTGSRRMRQKPKLGNDTIARLPMRNSASSTCRGWRVACNVWLSTTTSNASFGKASRSLSASPWITDRPWRTQALTPDWLSSMPRASTPFLARQIGEQRAVAAADVEHPRARLDHVGDQPQVAAQFVREPGRAAAGGATSRRNAALLLTPRPPEARQAAMLGAAGQEAAQRVRTAPARAAERRRGPCRSRSRQS